MDVPITIDLPFEHYCKYCNYFTDRKVTTRHATFREVLHDAFKKDAVEWEKEVDAKLNWCYKFNKHVEPTVQELCFEWSGSHEEWLPNIEAKVVNGKIEVTFK